MLARTLGNTGELTGKGYIYIFYFSYYFFKIYFSDTFYNYNLSHKYVYLKNNTVNPSKKYHP